jgi:ornithine cyclodeaminase
MRFIDSETVEKAASVAEWTDAMEQAMVKSVTGELLIPQRMHLDRGSDTFLLMPCMDDRYWATKLVSFCPGNAASGRQSIYGTVILSSSVTGEPLAVIDGTSLTANRTAGVSALGIKYLADENAENLGIIGTGAQGIHQAVFTCRTRPIRNVLVFDRSESAIEKFRKVFTGLFPGIKLIVAGNTEKICEACDIIITSTSSEVPVLPENPEVYSEQTFIGIGSYKPGSREYPEAFYKGLSQIFTDTLHGLKESGDLIYPLEKGFIGKDHIHSLGSLINGDVSILPGMVRFFKTVGSAVFDLFAARLVYEKMEQRNSS